MNTAINYTHHFYSESANDVTTLEKNVKENPTSAFARFLLLYHYKKNNDPEFEKFAKQSSLYFNNPYWLHLQLLQADLEYPDSTNHILSLPTEESHFEVTLPGENNDLKNENEEERISSGSKENSINSGEAEETINHDLPDKEETILPESQNESIYSKEQVNAINNDLTGENEFIHSASKDENIDLKEPEESFAFEPKEEILEADLQKNDAPFENINEEPLAFEPYEEIQETATGITPSESPINNTNTSISTNSEEEELVFEPLYTVDYFASQGIKIKEEALMDDKLGKQMKSFTAWLKSMKKLHPGKLPEQNEVIERIIQSSAEESNADAEVLTEAMAEVLIKQNKQEKAVEMYQKLSLLNPSKSTYFAAKIESLKII